LTGAPAIFVTASIRHVLTIASRSLFRYDAAFARKGIGSGRTAGLLAGDARVPWPVRQSVMLSLPMHELNYCREHLEVFAEMAKKRGITLDLDAFRALDKERRELISTIEGLKARRNKASDQIAQVKKNKQNSDLLIAEMKQVSERIKQGDERIAQLDATQRE